VQFDAPEWMVTFSASPALVDAVQLATSRAIAEMQLAPIDFAIASSRDYFETIYAE
jgi:hypothetical protein